MSPLREEDIWQSGLDGLCDMARQLAREMRDQVEIFALRFLADAGFPTPEKCTITTSLDYDEDRNAIYTYTFSVGDLERTYEIRIKP